MHTLRREDVVGRRIIDIVVSVPDKPVSMSDMSYSASYLRLDSGLAFNLGLQPLHAADEAALTGVIRDAKHEREFGALLQQTIEDVVLMVDDGSLCVATRNSIITEVPAQFWVRPWIYKRAEFTYKTEPYWT
jgi:hypothetical protein